MTRVASILTAIVFAVVSAGCGSPLALQDSRQPASATENRSDVARPQPAATLPPQFRDVDRSDPTAVGQAALQVWFTWYPARDLGPVDAVARAAPLLTPELASSATVQRPARDPGVDWQRLAQERVEITATVEAGAEPVPPDKRERIYRSYSVTQTATASPLVTIATSFVDVVLQSEPDGWRVSAVIPR